MVWSTLGPAAEAFKKALHKIRGSYAFALMDSEDASTIYVAKQITTFDWSW